MINPDYLPPMPIIVTSPPEATAQAKGQENLSADFAGAAQRSCDAKFPIADYEDMRPGGASGALEEDNEENWACRAPSSIKVGAFRNDGDLHLGGNFVFGAGGEILFMPSQDTGTGTPHGASAAGIARIAPRSLAPAYEGPDADKEGDCDDSEDETGEEGRSVRLPASGSWEPRSDSPQPHRTADALAGTDQGRRLLAVTRNSVVGVATAPPSDSHVDAPTQQFLDEWSAAISEGPELCSQFFTGIIDKSVAAIKERIHAELERRLIELLAKLADHLRMPTLKQLLTQPKSNTVDLVEKCLPDIGKMIPDKDKKALTDLLDSVGIKWPKMFG